MADILIFIGALIPTYLLSRLFMFILKTWNGGQKKIYFTHGISLGAATLLGGIGMADGGAFAPIKALSAYALPQALWLVFDIIRCSKNKNL